MGKITLRPIGEIDQKIMETLQQKLEKTFNCLVEYKEGIKALASAYDLRRKQYLSAISLSSLDSLGVERGERVLGIADVDLYAPGLNYVFGEADISHQVAVISLRRLRQEFYGLPLDEVLLQQRAVTEAVHELGHTYGWGHCRHRKCVMFFSNTLSDTDRKQAAFCEECGRKLATKLKEGGK